MCIRVLDWKKPHTYYSLSNSWVNGNRTINIRLPLCPERGLLNVDNTDDPNDNEFSVKCRQLPLSTNLNVFDSTNQNTLQFIKFAEDFAERASYISAKRSKRDRSIYTSNDGKFVVHYVNEIIGDDGVPRKTSMRVNNRTGVMEIAKKYIVQYTIPERIAILLHEFSHFYLNKVHSDEFEADKNALMIYCGLGYPRKEGLTAFYKVFYRSPSDLNIARMKKIREFLQNFDTSQYKVVK